jgi:HEPN domain-containing protein
MVDITKQIEYWKNGSKEDFDVAKQLISNDKIRHGLFFAHLAIEKMLKAKVCQVNEEIAPRIHNLVRLAQIAEITLPEITLNLLAEMNEFNLEGRYPIPFISPISKPEAQDYIEKTERTLKWLTQQF